MNHIVSSLFYQGFIESISQEQATGKSYFLMGIIDGSNTVGGLITECPLLGVILPIQYDMVVSYTPQ